MGTAAAALREPGSDAEVAHLVRLGLEGLDHAVGRDGGVASTQAAPTRVTRAVDPFLAARDRR